MVVDQSAAAADRVRDVRVNGAPLDLNRTYTVAVPDFIFRGGDGYTMLAGQRVLVAPEAGNLITTALEKYVAANKEITQQVDGRITLR
jgi:2',3'-cyclic-nucleotide 2'-phosphodiesterase (5'-nucleotidase family)